VALLTREIVSGKRSGHLRVRTGSLNGHAPGFTGFLIGAGAGLIDYRAAALVQKASGQNGGILCVYESDGRLRFRDHSSEEHPLRFTELPSKSSASQPYANDVLLQLDIEPSAQPFSLKLTATDPATGQIIASAILDGVKESQILGGIMLVSSPQPGAAGARYWFREPATAGKKIAIDPGRSLGPILGAMHSINRRTLKLNVQLMPVGPADPQSVQLQFRRHGRPWREAAPAAIGHGFTALITLDNWDASRSYSYRVLYAGHTYSGLIRREPAPTRPLTIAVFSCVMTSWRSLEGGVFKPEVPGERMLGRYTHDSLYFPHTRLTLNASRHTPDLYAFLGDQLYENSPTRKDASADPSLDYLYKWYLWLWAFRDLTRDTPSIVLVDDHDVFQGNLWGESGRAAPDREQERGGYTCGAGWVNMVQRTQCAHNPDPDDPAPVERGITVYYGSFHFAGVSFAMIEDRKFKPGFRRETPLTPAEKTMLGARQEQFLERWASDPAPAKICFSQTAWACVQTSPEGTARQDYDSGGWPKPGRDRAVALIHKARALLVSGDQHLASVIRHLSEDGADGPVQFSGPGGSTSFQRWFEPSSGDPTFTDGFGNRFRMLAVANPKVTQAEYRKHKTGRGQGLGDQKLKSEGYAIVRVDHAQRQFILECWPFDVDPLSPQARQFPGWPVTIPFPPRSA
jgi:alkaline phosphatase D